MKTMQGALAWACWNMSRTRAAPTPTNISTKSEPGEAEEGDAGLAGDRLGQQGLAGARGADQQHALGDPPAEDLVFLRRLEEIDDLAEFVDGLVDAGHVVEGDAHFLLGVELAPAAAEGHGRARPAHLAEDQVHHQPEEPAMKTNCVQDRHMLGAASPRTFAKPCFFSKSKR